MADVKRYYWLKFKEDFFDSKRIKKLRKMAGGDTYVIIYLKMQLKALKTDGVLEFTGVEQEFADELALDIDESADDVRVVLAFLLTYGLCECSDNVHYYLPYVTENTGSETAAAQRMRDHRDKLKCNNVTPALRECCVEKEIEIEQEKETEKREKSKRKKSPVRHEANGVVVETQFDTFWREYPRKTGKGDARKKFAQALTKTSFQNLMGALAQVKTSSQWNRDGGRYIPLPATWLNQERWEDEAQPTDDRTNLRNLYEMFKEEENDQE